MKEPTARKAGAQKRGSKKYPKILAVPKSAEAIRAAYNLTPAEIRHAKRVLAEVEKERSHALK
jgi:hypothetical protein